MTNQSDMQWERRLRNMSMPRMDVHDQVMERLQRPAKGSAQENRWRIRLLPIATLMFILGTGFAYVGAVQLFDQNGEKVLSIQDYGGDNIQSPVSSVELDKYSYELQPGETVVVYRPYDNPHKIIQSYTKPEPIYDYSAMRQRFGSRYPLPGQLPDRYIFKEGFANYVLHLPAEMIDELHVQGDQSGETVTKTITDDGFVVYGVSLKMEREGLDYALTIFDGQRFDTMNSELEHHVDSDIVSVNGIQGYVAVIDGRQQLLWRSGNDIHSRFYVLTTSDLSEGGKKRLVELLEAFVLEESP